MPVPIFILGKGRSGTTWLANQLSEHSRIAATRHVLHHGVKESDYFSHIDGRFGDLTVRSNFVEFVEIVGSSDYMNLAGISKEFLYSLWGGDYAEIFRAAMDDFANRQGADFWLEKTPYHTPLAYRLAAYYPDAYFISIRRPAVQVISSTMPHWVRTHPKQSKKTAKRLSVIIKTLFNWAYCNRVIASLGEAHPRAMTIDYKELRRSPENVLTDACGFLGLRFEETLLLNRFKKNSSFTSEEERSRVLTRSEQTLIRLLRPLAEAIPLSVCYTGGRLRRDRRKELPYGFFFLFSKGEFNRK